MSTITSARALLVLALAVPLAAGAPAEPEAPAAVTAAKLDGRLFATVETLVDKRLTSGFTVRLFRFSTRYGECAGDDQLGGPDDPTCPQQGLIVSVWQDRERQSTFPVWQISPRRDWALVGTPTTTVSGVKVGLEACEAVGKHLRRKVGYRLSVEGAKLDLVREAVAKDAPTC